MIDTNPSRRTYWKQAQNVDLQDPLFLPPYRHPHPRPHLHLLHQTMSSLLSFHLLHVVSPLLFYPPQYSISIDIVEHNKMLTAVQNMLQQLEESKRDKEQTNKILTQQAYTLQSKCEKQRNEQTTR